MMVSFSNIQHRFLCFRSKPSYPPPPPPPPPSIDAATAPAAAPTPSIESDHSGDSVSHLHRHTHAPPSSVSVVQDPSNPDPSGLPGASGVGTCETDATGSREGSPDDRRHHETEPPCVAPRTEPGNGIRSSLRKRESSESDGVEIRKKTVQWMDFLGKDLVEVNEFESSYAGSTDDEGMTNRGCLCNLL